MLGGPNAVHVLPILHNGHSMVATSKRETDLLGGTLKHSPSRTIIHHGRPMPSLAEAGLIWMVQIYGISWLGNHWCPHIHAYQEGGGRVRLEVTQHGLKRVWAWGERLRLVGSSSSPASPAMGSFPKCSLARGALVCAVTWAGPGDVGKSPGLAWKGKGHEGSTCVSSAGCLFKVRMHWLSAGSATKKLPLTRVIFLYRIGSDAPVVAPSAYLVVGSDGGCSPRSSGLVGPLTIWMSPSMTHTSVGPGFGSQASVASFSPGAVVGTVGSCRIFKKSVLCNLATELWAFGCWCNVGFLGAAAEKAGWAPSPSRHFPFSSSGGMTDKKLPTRSWAGMCNNNPFFSGLSDALATIADDGTSSVHGVTWWRSVAKGRHECAWRISCAWFTPKFNAISKGGLVTIVVCQCSPRLQDPCPFTISQDEQKRYVPSGKLT